jgi:hypothetical protein
MTDHEEIDSLSRRGVLAALGAAAASGVAMALPGVAEAAPATSLPIRPVADPSALGAVQNGLTYVAYDGSDFHGDLFFPNPGGQDGGTNNSRAFDPAEGYRLQATGQVSVGLALPSGSSIRQINVGYTSTPIINVYRRPLASPNTTTQFISQTLAAGSGPKTQTFDLSSSPIAIDENAAYTLRFFLGPGDGLWCASVGYLPPTQSFQPFTGTNPRVYDSRVSGGLLNPGEDRTISVGGNGARSAVFNLAVDGTLAGTTGAGFVGAYSAALVAWPGNASVNWSAKGSIVSNTVISAVDGSGRIKLHGGVSPIHVVIDAIGYLV